MSTFALKLFSVCGLSMLKGEVYSRFGAEDGVLLANFPSKLSKATKTWNGDDLSPKNIHRLREIVEMLMERKAIVDYGSNSIQQTLPALENAFLDPKRTLDYAICDDNLNLKPAAKRYLISTDTVMEKRVFTHKKSMVEMNAKSLLEFFTTYIYECSSFKIVDPYFFEMTEKQVDKKLNFLIHLCEGLRQYSPEMIDQIEIEVIGRDYFYDKKKQRVHKCDIDLIKRQLGMNHKLKALSQDFNIKFIGLDDSHTNRSSVHLRYFFTDRYLFSLEHTFEERSGEQNVWFDTTEDRSLFQKTYREDSVFLNKSFSFYADDIW